MNILMIGMIWLILARAVQGIGAGSIMGLTQMVISDIVSLEERGKYSGFIGATVPPSPPPNIPELTFVCSGPSQV
jgi:MFS family permease